MKKLTKLQIMLLMNLAVNSLHLQAESNQEYQDEAIDLTLQAEKLEDAGDNVLQILENQNPEMLAQIALEEADLHDHFNAIRNLVQKKNKEIEKLSAQAEVDEAQIAKIGIELADAQIALKKAQASHRAKHKNNHRLEQFISDALKKAEQSLKKLNDSAAAKAMKKAAVDSGNYISKKAEQAYELASEKSKKAMKSSKKKSKASKAVVKASAQQPMLMNEDMMIDQAIDDAMLNDEKVVVQSTSDSSNQSERSRDKKRSKKHQHKNRSTEQNESEE